MQVMFIKRRVWFIIGLTFVLPLFTAIAQEDNDQQSDTTGDWKTEREKIKQFITKKVNEEARKYAENEVKKEIKKIKDSSFEKDLKNRLKGERNRYLEREKLRWADSIFHQDHSPQYPAFNYFPIDVPDWEEKNIKKKPEHSFEEIKKSLEKKLDKAFEKAYQEPDVTKLEEEGHKKYVLYQLGDGIDRPNVEVQLRGGKGTNTRVKGRLQAVRADRLQIQNRYINRNDLDEESQAMFYKEVNDRFVKEYVQTELRKYHALRENYVSDWCEFLLPDELMKELYIPKNYDKIVSNQQLKNVERLKRISTNSHNWISRIDFVKNMFIKKFTDQKAKLTPKMENEIFPKASETVEFDDGSKPSSNYEKYKGEWMPQSVANSLREAEQQQQQQGPGGEFGGQPPADMARPQ